MEKDHGGMSGFYSKIEKDAFHYLSKGDQPIMMALEKV